MIQNRLGQAALREAMVMVLPGQDAAGRISEETTNDGESSLRAPWLWRVGVAKQDAFHSPVGNGLHIFGSSVTQSIRVPQPKRAR